MTSESRPPRAKFDFHDVQPPGPSEFRKVTGSEIVAKVSKIAAGEITEADVSVSPAEIETASKAILVASVIDAQDVAAMTPPARSYGKCTPELTEKMVKLVIEGNFPDTVTVACGISLDTYYFWRERGQRGEEPYATWWNAMVQACALSEIEAVRQIRQGDDRGAGFGPAKAALELISRRNKRWSPNIKVEVADQLTRFIDVAERICPPEMFALLLEGLAAEDQDND